MIQHRYSIVIHRSTLFVATLLAMVAATQYGEAEEPNKVGLWTVEQPEDASVNIHTMEVTLHSRAEPSPALKYKFIADDIHLLDGNAATYYLKAQGFFEQTAARARLNEFYEKSLERSRNEDIPYSELPPESWRAMRPDDLPLDEVKEFLTLTSFQTQFLKEAAKRRRFDLDRDIQNIEDPIGYLLPEIQTMRALARMQTLRFKVAIAEDRLDNAIEILGQQYALGRHLGQDDFLVTNLVGMAITGIAWEDALHLIQHPEAPNLYWAYASLPNPVVDVGHAMSVERQFLYLQFKVLREVDETPRPVGYWQDFLDRLVPQIRTLAHDFRINGQDTETTRAAVVAYIAAAYPGAKRYLLEELGMQQDQVDAYPVAQVVFLAMVRYYDSARDDYFKWLQLPYWQTRHIINSPTFDAALRANSDRAGWSSAPTQLLLPAIRAVHTAVARYQQKIALIQTIEAIRMYGAANEGQLPQTLDDLPVPTPLEPFTGKPLDYKHNRDHAVLSGHEISGTKSRFVLRIVGDE